MNYCNKYLYFLFLGGYLAQQVIAFTAISQQSTHPTLPRRTKNKNRLWDTKPQQQEDKDDKIYDVWKTFPGWMNAKNSSENPIVATSSSSTENTSGLLQTIEVVTAPVQQMLNDYSSGWALSYADLTPDTSATTPGQVFLATNLAYLLAGLLLQFQGANELGLATDLCAAFSFQYHYQQLEVTNTVRAALLLDYVFAALAMGLATFYLVTSVAVTSLFSMNVAVAVGLAVVSLGCLGLSWKYEYGQPYMFWHGLWHLASAAAGYSIGDLHNTVM